MTSIRLPSSIMLQWHKLWAVLALLAMSLLMTASLRAEVKAPDALIAELSTTVLDRIKADPAIQDGDFNRISTLVDETIMPHVDFERMTALAVGRGWRDASAEQKEALTREFRVLLLRTYSGALSQIKDEKVSMRPLRASPDDTEVIVRSDIVGRRDPIQLNYRLDKQADGWKIFDINVLGVWLIETYRNQFKQIVNRDGVDGLVKTLTEKNKQFAAAQ